jgi:hypothetical protein
MAKSEELVNSFLDAVNDDSAMNTEYLVCPELESAPATVEKIEVNVGTYTDKKTQQERKWANLQLVWDIDSEEARQVVKRDKVSVRQTIMLAFNKDETALDNDNNQTLGRLLKMFDIDKAGKTNGQLFESFVGRFAYVKVVQRHIQNKEKELQYDGEGNPRMMPEVVAVSTSA